MNKRYKAMNIRNTRTGRPRERGMKMAEEIKSIFELKFLMQRWEGLEAWIKENQSDVWVRLDFFLEYYISGNMNLTKKYQGQLKNEEIAKQYYQLLYSKFLQKTSGGSEFNLQEYINWQRNNKDDITKALELMSDTPPLSRTSRPCVAKTGEKDNK